MSSINFLRSKATQNLPSAVSALRAGTKENGGISKTVIPALATAERPTDPLYGRQPSFSFQTASRSLSTTASIRSPTIDRPVAAAIPYSGPALHGVASDLVLNSDLHLNEDEKYWVPQLENVWYRPLLFSLSQGYWVNLLRVRKSGILSRHRHTGPVHAATLKGKWHYLEHDWWATPGSYSYEPPGDIHTLEVPEGVEEMVTLFHVT
jgi:quercetin dioxygenase-like cupin family protein